MVLQVEDTTPDGFEFIPQNITFSCKASGTSRPTITWTFSGSVIYSHTATDEEAVGYFETRSNLTFVGIQPSLVTSNISCRAENELGVEETYAYLNTLCK